MSLRGWALWGSVSGIEYACVCKLKEREQKVVLWEEKKKEKNFIERDWDFHHLSIKLFHISPCQHSTRLNYQTRQGPFVLTHATFISLYLQLFFLLLLLFYFPQNLHKQCMNTPLNEYHYLDMVCVSTSQSEMFSFSFCFCCAAAASSANL